MESYSLGVLSDGPHVIPRSSGASPFTLLNYVVKAAAIYFADVINKTSDGQTTKCHIDVLHLPPDAANDRKCCRFIYAQVSG